MSTSAKKPVTGPERRTNQAVEVFQKGMKALGKREFDRAQEHFDEIIASYPEERDVVERAKSFRALCRRSLHKGPAVKPKTFEELVQHGVYLHNRGEFEDALKYLRQATEMHPRNEHALYCQAATAARAGDGALALKSLRSAIAASPESRAHARRDSDFDSLRDEDEFQAILHGED
ncbi:MAG TPA: tetratricopeptide repeat protein [Vicinamibacteria bacterium]|jgi:tetratricopeptide (TPR) repeat protein